MSNPTESINENHEVDRVARPGDRPVDRPEPTLQLPEGLWGVTDVSRYLQIPVSSIYKMTAQHAAVPIPHIRIGGKLRFRRTDIDRWLALLTTTSSDSLRKIRRNLER